MSKLAKVGQIDLGKYGLDPNSEDAIALQSAVDSGEDEGAAAKALGLVLTESGEVDRCHEPPAMPAAAKVTEVQENAYSTGRELIRGARNAQAIDFQRGVQDEISEGASSHAAQIQGIAEGGLNALKFRSSH